MLAPSALRLCVRLQPRARRTRLAGRNGDVIKAQVHAPPVAGAANAALIDLLAETLDMPRAAIRIVRGETSRTKLVEVRTSDVAACEQRLAAALLASVDKKRSGD
jgi:uncharacterized protein (TIGR00251 family)